MSGTININYWLSLFFFFSLFFYLLHINTVQLLHFFSLCRRFERIMSFLFSEFFGDRLGFLKLYSFFAFLVSNITLCIAFHTSQLFKFLGIFFSISFLNQSVIEFRFVCGYCVLLIMHVWFRFGFLVSVLRKLWVFECCFGVFWPLRFLMFLRVYIWIYVCIYG